MTSCFATVSKDEIFTINEATIFANIEATVPIIRKQGNLSSWQLPSSETQGQSVRLGKRARQKFSSTGERAPGYRLSLNYFQNFKRPDWAQKMLCIIVPNR